MTTKVGGGLQPALDGQLIIGDTGAGKPSISTLTAGTGVTITNTPGSIEISSTGGGGSGKLVQQTFSQTSAVINILTVFSYPQPTPPTINQGLQILTQSFTPTNANNFIYVQLNVMGSLIPGAIQTVSAAIFADAVGPAVAYCTGQTSQVSSIVQNNCSFSLTYRQLAGGTSAQEWSVNVGPSFNQFTLNANSGGAAAICSLTMWEIQP